MNSGVAIDIVDAAWAALGGDLATSGELTAAYNRVSALAVTTTTMSNALQHVRTLHKENDPAVKGHVAAVAEGYGRGAQWYRIDTSKVIAEDHVGYIIADHIRRLHSDVASEVRPGKAGHKLRTDLDSTYSVIKPLWEGVFARNGLHVELPDKLPVSY
jgi:hypothetical protein